MGDENDECIKCPANAICRGGCESNPSADTCSDPVWFPEGLDQEYKELMLGGLEWIPKAMPYPIPGYYQELAYAPTKFEGKVDLATGEPQLDDCPREGQGACWWPLTEW